MTFFTSEGRHEVGLDIHLPSLYNSCHLFIRDSQLQFIRDRVSCLVFGDNFKRLAPAPCSKLHLIGLYA